MYRMDDEWKKKIGLISQPLNFLSKERNSYSGILSGVALNIGGLNGDRT